MSRIKISPEIWVSACVFLLLWIHGSLLGPSDDEAYYWFLAQNPSLGFTYHPPGVIWMIALFQWIFGWIFTNPSSALLRLSSAVLTSLIVAIAIRWMKWTEVPESRLHWGSLGLLSFAGFFGGAWMIVPDVPMLLGWMMCFTMSWKMSFQSSKEISRIHYFLLGAGSFILMISKFSGVLAIFSAALALAVWSRGKVRKTALLSLAIGFIAALIPILIWNASHDWISILYQMRTRHGSSGEWSWRRYGLFWGSQLLLAGPALLAYSAVAVFRSRFIAVWVIPVALVFCIQPGWSEFKPHWALVVWFPIALELGRAWGRGEFGRIGFYSHCMYGIPMITLLLLSCHFPLISWVTEAWNGTPTNPRYDVTNDLYGWEQLRAEKAALPDVPWTASRYQTASQAAFALGETSRLTWVVPNGAVAKGEWPQLAAFKSQTTTSQAGNGWPELVSPVLYVSDHRYSNPPEFVGAECGRVKRLETSRGRYPAKWIEVWLCRPK